MAAILNDQYDLCIKLRCNLWTWERATYTLNKLMDVNKMIPLLRNSSSTRQRTLLGFQIRVLLKKRAAGEHF